MDRIPLITSLPPRMTRRGMDGRDIGAEYQRRCVRSWKESGFTSVISVNARHEVDTAPGLTSMANELGVRIVPVDRDASQVVGRPLVYIADLLKAACEAAEGGPFAIINADILLAYKAGVLDAVTRSVAPKRFVLARREGVKHLEERVGEPYYGGIDFFAAHSSDAAAVPDIGMIIGAFWWDHYFPLLMCANDAEPVQLRDMGIIHLEHDERCGGSLWQELGERFLHDVRSLVSSAPLASSANSVAYAAALQRAIQRKTSNPLLDLAYHARRRLPAFARHEPEKVLERVALANVRFLDQLSELTPKNSVAA